jgi:nitrogen fixation protein NifU and related proteins
MDAHGQYSDLLLDHYRRPRNAGDLSHPDVVVTVGNPSHGDVMRLSLRFAEGRIAEAGFKVFGCAAAIAAGSVTTEMIRGKRLEEAETITNGQVAEALGGLPEGKIHCSVLAEQALREALSAYRRDTGERRQDSPPGSHTHSGSRAEATARPTPDR